MLLKSRGTLCWVLDHPLHTTFSACFPIVVNTVQCALAETFECLGNAFLNSILTTKWLKPLNMLICAVALPAGHLVYRFPKLLKLKTTTIFFPSTPISISQSGSKSKDFCVKLVWIESGLCRLLALWLWASYVSTLRLSYLIYKIGIIVIIT